MKSAVSKVLQRPKQLLEKTSCCHLFKAAIFFLFHKASQAGWKLPCSYPTTHIPRHLMLVLRLSMNNRFAACRKRKGRKEEA